MNPRLTLTPGYTVAATRLRTISDDGVFWSIGTWDDGSFRLGNGANGTAWRLGSPTQLVTASVVMSSNITAPQPKQESEFTELDFVDDLAFPTIIVRP